MNIEEIAFKDRTELAHLNGIDLLNIIEFLQKDRKQWINQFTQTHNESVEIQKENNELKKQLEDISEELELIRCDLHNRTSERDGYERELNECLSQQKEFIKYLEDEIYNIEPNGTGINYNCEYDSEEDYVMAMREQSRLNTLKEILQKYKEIIGVSDEKK